MKILIELYDREPIYNYLAAAVFCPDKVYFVGDREVLNDKVKIKSEKFARIMGLDCGFVFRFAKSNSFEQVRSEISKIIDAERRNGNECVVDVTGGRDLALVAAGTLMDEGTQIIYYDKEINSFRLLSSGETKKVELDLPCEAFITAAGGTVFENARNLDFSPAEWDMIRRITDIYFEFRDSWNRFVKYLQRISKKEGGKVGDCLDIDAPLSLTEGGKTYSANPEIMRELEKVGAVKSLEVSHNRMKFRYANADLAMLLVNEGIWLEMCVYLTAKDMPEFSDAQVGVKFVWDIPDGRTSIGALLSDTVPRNEVDVVLSRGVTPVFISCKTREPMNEDLNELYAIKEHFGGEMAAAIMATTKYVGKESPVYERAKAMGIGIIDERNFENGTVASRLLRLIGG